MRKNKGINRYSVLIFMSLCICLTTDAGSPGAREDYIHVSLDNKIYKLCHAISIGDFKSAKTLLQCQDSHEPLFPLMQELMLEYDEIEVRRNDAVSTYLNDLDNKLQKMNNLTEYDPLSLDAILRDIRSSHDLTGDEVSVFLNENTINKLKMICKLHTDSLIESSNYIEAHKFFRIASFLFGDNDPDYIDYGRELNEMAFIQSIEQSYSQIEPEGIIKITPDIVIHAIRLLDFKYVSVIDYKQLAEKTLYRCKMLGILWPGVSDGEYYKWQEWIESESMTILKSNRFNRDHLLGLLSDLIHLNRITLNMPEQLLILNISQSFFQALDLHTFLVWPHQKSEFQKKLTQEYSGIGIVLGKSVESFTIREILPNTPAFKSSLNPDDQIIEINGQPTADMDLNNAVSLLTGPTNTSVELVVRCSDSSEKRTIVLQRKKIIISSVQGWQSKDSQNWNYILDDHNRIGYIKISGFTKDTATDFKTIMNNLQHVGLNGLILDLRFNSGGYLSAAVEIADMFIENGPLVKNRPRWGYVDYQQATAEGAHTGFPIVILINGATASSAEVLAGILRDPLHQRAILVGEKTYGKGSVQTITSVPGTDALLKYTVSRYCLPSGQEVASRDSEFDTDRTNYGVMPDIEIKLLPNEHQTLLSIQRTNRFAKDNPLELDTKSQVEGTLKSDAQLSLGLLVLKSMMIKLGYM